MMTMMVVMKATVISNGVDGGGGLMPAVPLMVMIAMVIKTYGMAMARVMVVTVTASYAVEKLLYLNYRERREISYHRF